jgi:hypothetical protein
LTSGRRTKDLSAAENARIDGLVRDGSWRKCGKCQVRLPLGVPCGCDPAGLGAYVRQQVFAAGGICRPCAGGRHIHGVCVLVAGCQCKVGVQ